MKPENYTLTPECPSVDPSILIKERLNFISKELRGVSTEIFGGYGPDCCVPAVPTPCLEDLAYIIDDLYGMIYRLMDRLHDHEYKGHLPPINSVEKLREILSILKLDQEYTVESKTLYATDGKKNNLLQITAKAED